MTSGVKLISAERNKQIKKHGFTGEHHYSHPEWYDKFQLQYAATTLLMHEFAEVVDTKNNLPDGWDQEWFDKLNSKTRRERLIIAGALIAAELDRLYLDENKKDMRDREHVITISDDGINKDWVKGQTGWIDGYCSGGDGNPYAVVIIDTKLVMIPLHALEVLPI